MASHSQCRRNCTGRNFLLWMQTELVKSKRAIDIYKRTSSRQMLPRIQSCEARYPCPRNAGTAEPTKSWNDSQKRRNKKTRTKPTMMYARALDWAHRTQRTTHRSSTGSPQTLAAAAAVAGIVTAGLVMVTRRTSAETAVRRHSAKLSLDSWRSVPAMHVVACSPYIGDNAPYEYDIALVSQSGDVGGHANSTRSFHRELRMRRLSL